MSERHPIEQITLCGLLADPATSFALKVVIGAWAGRELVDAAHDAWRLFVAFAWEADQRFGAVS